MKKQKERNQHFRGGSDVSGENKQALLARKGNVLQTEKEILTPKPNKTHSSGIRKKQLCKPLSIAYKSLEFPVTSKGFFARIEEVFTCGR